MEGRPDPAPDSAAEPEPEPESDLRTDRPRIFGIGLNKTATSSLHEALTILGFRSLHDGGPEIHDAVERSIEAGEPLLSNLDPKLDAFSDIGLLSRRFRMLDAQYPGSRFVLTVRPFDAWIDSRRRHVERNLRRIETGDYDGTFRVIDVAKWTAEWERHMERVHNYFAHRSNFFEIDLTQDPEWGPLCRFLGLDEPETPFPWANRDAALHATVEGTDGATDGETAPG